MADASHPDALLAETAWLRRLASQLTGDAALAEDLQQDVAVAALTQAQAAGGRSWLAAVARNLSVTGRRRRAIERRAAQRLARPQPAPSAAELVATAELQQKAVAAVLELAPAYRDTVLLRFMRGLSLAEAAAAMDVSQETVRTRQRRALALLRQRLAPARRDWRGALAALVPFASWGVTMKSKHVLSAGAVLVLALLCVVPFLPGGPGPRDAGAATDPVRVASAPPPAETTPPVPPAGPADRVQVQPAPTPPPEASTARLTVRVRWQDGAPAAAVAVHCNLQQRAGRFTVTDAAGEARIEDLAPGRYWITSPQYATKVAQLAAGAHETVELEMKPGFAVQGEVVDADGRPAADAEVTAANAGVFPNWDFPMARTDRLGRFTIRGCSGGMLVGAHATGLGIADPVMLTNERHGGASPERVVLRLSRAVTRVHGRVVDGQGDPVTGAWVHLRYEGVAFTPDANGRLWAPPPMVYGTTDSEGRFSFDLVRTQCDNLLVYKEGLAPHSAKVPLQEGVPRELDVVLRPGGTLTGKVTREDGAPVAGAEVGWSYSYPEQRATTTAADGAFELRDLPPGELAFTAEVRDLPKQRRTITFRGDEAQVWDVVMRQGLRVHGRLVDDKGAPLAGWWLALPSASRRSETDADGRFVVAGCKAAGSTLILWQEMGFAPEVMRFEKVLPSEETQTFSVPADRHPSARMLGQCVGQDGRPLAEATLDIKQNGRAVILGHEAFRAGADGTFDCGPFPPGTYRVTPSHQTLVFDGITVELHPGARLDLGRLQGAVPGKVVVRLQGDTGAVAWVELVAADKTKLFGLGKGDTRTFAKVMPGRYRICFRSKSGYHEGVEVEVRPGATIDEQVEVR